MKRIFVVSLFIIILAGIFLRFSFLDKTFWIDEFFTIKEAKEISFFNPNETIGLNPYFILVYFTIKIFGISEIPLRELSIFFSVATIASLYFIGKKIFNKQVGILSATFFLFSP